MLGGFWNPCILRAYEWSDNMHTEMLLEMNEKHIKALPFVPLNDHAIMITICRALRQVPL